MRFHIVPAAGYLRAELQERETAGETREFVEAIAVACTRYDARRVLICVHASRPIFKVEQYRASFYLGELARRPGARVALVSGGADVRAAHEYLEVLGGQHGAALRSFAHEATAIAWLRGEQVDASRGASSAKRVAAKSP